MNVNGDEDWWWMDQEPIPQTHVLFSELQSESELGIAIKPLIWPVERP